MMEGNVVVKFESFFVGFSGLMGLIAFVVLLCVIAGLLYWVKKTGD